MDLQALARNAAMKAEREAIDQALAKFRWNRRKAAAYLKVSYKTLLNKMKECGISEPGRSVIVAGRAPSAGTDSCTFSCDHARSRTRHTERDRSCTHG